MDNMRHADNIGYQSDAYMSYMGNNAESKSGRGLRMPNMRHAGDIGYDNDAYGLSFNPRLEAREPGSF